MRSGGDPAIPARIDRRTDGPDLRQLATRTMPRVGLRFSRDFSTARYRWRCVFRQLPQSFANPVDCFAAAGLLQFNEREAVGPGPGQRSRPAPMKILTCNANRPLAEAISAYLKLPLTQASVRRFSDMEVFVEIQENVRGEDIFVIQPTSYPANDNLMELLVTLDALKRASARRVTAVIPYYGYARQDRKTSSRSPISAKLVANLITAAGADRVLDPRPSCSANPGLLRHSDRQSLRLAGAGEGHPGNSRQAGAGDRVARCRWRCAGARHRATARRRSGDHRQAARARRRTPR